MYTMNQTNLIDKSLANAKQKMWLFTRIKNYLLITNPTEHIFIYRLVELLKQKYNNSNDINFLEQCLRQQLQNSNRPIDFHLIATGIHNCENAVLISELLECFDVMSGFIMSQINESHMSIEKNVIQGNDMISEMSTKLDVIGENNS